MGHIAYKRNQPLPQHLKQNTELFIHGELVDLVKHAHDDNPQQNINDLFATLIYNYLGKLCLDNNQNIVQVTLGMLEHEVSTLEGKATKCLIDVDKVLSLKVSDLFKQERAYTKAIEFNGTKATTDKDLRFFLTQMKSPHTGRKKHPLPDGVASQIPNFPIYKYHHREKNFTEKTYPKGVSFRTRDKDGASHTTKTPGSLSPTEPRYMEFFLKYTHPIILVYDFDECYHEEEKYTFYANAGTNSNTHYSKNRTEPGSAQLYRNLEGIRQQNATAVANHQTIKFNEIRAGLPKRGVKAVIIEDTPVKRLYALEVMYIIKEEFQLEHDLPIQLYKDTSDLKDYPHADRIEDAIKACWHENKPALFKSIVNSSYHRIHNPVEKQRLSASLKIIYEDRSTWQLPVDPAYQQGTSQKYKHTFNPHVANTSTSEKGLSIAGILTIIPMVGYGAYKMLEDAIDVTDGVLEISGKVLGILLATTLLLPALVYGCYSAIKM